MRRVRLYDACSARPHDAAPVYARTPAHPQDAPTPLLRRCGHCKQFAKGYGKAADNLRGIVQFGAVNAESSPKTAIANGVQGYPTVKLYLPEVGTP